MQTLQQSLQYNPEELKFGTSGLRGLVTDMTDLECYINTTGFLKFLGKSDNLKQGSTIYLAGDLRDSTPKIMGAVCQAITNAGHKTVNCGLIPTPALAFYAAQHNLPCVMVTGSHIPADRNGIKFYKASGEVLKADEVAIKQTVTEVRNSQYKMPAQESIFNAKGGLLKNVQLPTEDSAAAKAYLKRYTLVFGDSLKGKKVVFYQHSAVGRDMLVELLQDLGAEVVPVGRSDKFVPIDTENVTDADKRYFRQLASEYPDAFAIVSTDGDSDRPFVIDAQGVFYRGDELGAVVATRLKADFAGLPISSSDAVGAYLKQNGIEYRRTKIGSPYVIEAMQTAAEMGKKRIVGWEVNGGFLLGCQLEANEQILAPLATRDAIFPIIVALLAAKDSSVAEVFNKLPKRFTSSGLIDNFATEVSAKIVSKFASDSAESREELGKYFTPELGFGKVKQINTLDGIRIFFENGDIAHLRPSGNAPQLRIYSVANSKERADQIVGQAISEPDGIFRKIEKNFAPIYLTDPARSAKL